MPTPHPKKPHEKGVGTKLIAPANTDFMKLFINDLKKTEWAIDQVSNEGPEHKQVLNTMLVQQLAALVKAIEAKTGSTLQLQPGEIIVSHKHDNETSIPVPFPLVDVHAGNKNSVLEIVSKAPAHEALMYAILQQVTTWGSKVLTANN